MPKNANDFIKVTLQLEVTSMDGAIALVTALKAFNHRANLQGAGMLDDNIGQRLSSDLAEAVAKAQTALVDFRVYK